MITKLRKRFIRIALLAVSLVVAVLISALLIGTYVSMRSDLTKTLDMLVENDGSLPFPHDGQEGPPQKQDETDK